MFHANNPVEDWWFNSDKKTPFPGKVALFVGAGISIDSPTCLPSGIALTTALLNHLLDNRAAEEILDVFQKCEPIIGRKVPRLEHILDTVCNRSDFTSEAPETNPKNLLRLFEGRPPNSLHQMIANHLAQKRGWVITTNFDDCIERAYFELSGNTLPVHVIHPEKHAPLILNNPEEKNWGLVKLHGTIELGVTGLSATLTELVPGLHRHFQELLTHIFESVDVVIVAGYSGTDYFDVNDWIRKRMNARTKPRLIWIKHADIQPSDITDKDDDQLEAWRAACAGNTVIRGSTTEHVSTLLGQPINVAHKTDAILNHSDLPTQLEYFYKPSQAQRHLNGAYLGVSVGIGQLAEEEFRLFRRETNDDIAGDALAPRIYASMGRLHEAHQMFALLDKHYIEPSVSLQRATLYRQAGHPIRALLHIGNTLLGKRNLSQFDECVELRFEAIECILDIVEFAQRYSIFRTKLMRWPMEKIIDLMWPTSVDHTDQHNIVALEGKSQMAHLRQMVLFEDIESETLRSLCLLLDEQVSYPDLYLESGPAIPGFYLTALSTCQEEDKLVEMLHTQLMFVRILLDIIRRKWPRGKLGTATTHWTEEAHVALVEKFLHMSDHIARALGEPHLIVKVAKQWCKADRMLGGFPYWRRQRLYLS